MRKPLARRSSSPRRTVSRAPQDSGLIANAKTLKQSAGTKSALDNRSHRTLKFSWYEAAGHPEFVVAVFRPTGVHAVNAATTNSEGQSPWIR